LLLAIDNNREDIGKSLFGKVLMDFSIQNNTAEKSYINKTAVEAFSPIVPVRRMACLPDEINQGHYAKAAGLTALMAINLPEDTRDIKAAVK